MMDGLNRKLPIAGWLNFRTVELLRRNSSEGNVLSVQSRIVTEGTTKLFVPDQSEPVKYPSFFNPQGKFVRDVSITCYRAYGETLKSAGELHTKLTFADSLSGTGARGVRVANELSEFFNRVFMNDVSPTSLELAARSAKENEVVKTCVFSQEEACSFLLSRHGNEGDRFDIVDVDPFGTPSPFVDCGLRAVRHGGMLSVSATDTAVLCGVYPKVAQRKYLGRPLRTDYAHEIGLRLIFGLLSMTAMRLESSIRPLFCHHDMHYFRVYCLVEIGNNFSRQNEAQIGYVSHCFKCGFRKLVSREEFTSDLRTNLTCPDCKNSEMKVAGPLWVGKIQSTDFVANCAEISDLAIFQPESDTPLYYDLSELSDKMQTRTPKISEVMREIQSTGRSATRTRLNRNAVRTDAPLRELRSVLARLSR